MYLSGFWVDLRRARCAAVLTIVCAAGVCSAPLPCAAQTAKELDRARELFQQGVSLEAAGDWAGALAKFQEVGKVKLTPQVRFHIARCKEQLGRLNEALGEYRLAEYEAGQQRISELEAIKQAREQLEARVPTILITRGPGAEVARVSLDGVELGEKQIGTRISVDPGPHTIAARLPGNLQFQESIVVQEREEKTVQLVPPEGLGQKAEPESTSTSSSATSGTDDMTADTGQTESGQTILPWVVGGLGVASLAASGVFFVLRNDAKSELDDICRGDVCPKSAEDTQDRGELYSTLSTITLGVGVVGLGVATVLLLTSGSENPASESARGVTLDVRGSTAGGGVTVRGSF